MTGLRILAIVLVMTAGSASKAMTVESVQANRFAIVSDGPAVCRIFHTGTYVSGIDCKIERPAAKPAGADTQVKIEFNVWYSGTVTRKAIGGRTCYVFEGSRTGGMSCL